MSFAFLFSFVHMVSSYMGPSRNIQDYLSILKSLTFFFFKKDFIYLFPWERKKQAQAEGGAEGEAESLLSREPDLGLYPRTPGSWLELKADA